MFRIKFKDVIKRYNDILAIDNLSLEIKEGEIFGLLGPNGAGKSTLISMLCGLVSIDKGDVTVGDYSIIKDPKKVKSFIGYVPQELAIFEELSVVDNLDYFGRMYSLRGENLKQSIKNAIEVTGLEKRKRDKVRTLSGGMKRRLNIACAILHNPKILIMDEPTVGIDPQSRNHILDFAVNLNKQHNTTIIYTSHYMEEVEAICDNITILDKGREIISGTKEEILKSVVDEATLNVIVDKINRDVIVSLKSLEGIKDININENKNTISLIAQNTKYNLEDILKTIFENNCQIKNMNLKEPNLETVFLNITGKKLRD